MVEYHWAFLVTYEWYQLYSWTMDGLVVGVWHGMAWMGLVWGLVGCIGYGVGGFFHVRTDWIGLNWKI